MPKTKYKYNPHTLKYDIVQHSLRKKLLRVLPHFIVSILLSSLMYFVIFVYLIDSPKEKFLKKENSNLKAQYQILNNRMDLAQKVLTDLSKRDDNIYRSIFEAEPIPNTIREAGIGGINRYEEIEGYENSELVISTARKLDKILKKIEVQSKSYDEIIKMVAKKQQMLTSIPAIQPLSNKDLIHFASGFGFRMHPIYKTSKFHYGIDLTASVGTDIYVTGDGVVEKAAFSQRGYGNEIVVNHGFGYKTLYAHLNSISVREGQKVKRGEVIGKVGNTGLSSAPHLHYEVHYKNTPVDPINFFFEDITPEEYEKIVEISSQSGQTLD
jgi:murein DD-endopeptidase MepM/ murein hydrolase activator NlpD